MENDKIEEYFDSIADRRDHWLEKNRYYYEQINQLARFVVPPGSRVLELGCGTGNLLHAVRPAYGAGVDISGRMIDIARKKYPRYLFIHSSIEKLELDEEFEYIIISDTLNTVYDVQAALNKIRDLTSPRTRVLITTFNYLWHPVIKLATAISQRMPQPVPSWLSQFDIENLCELADLETVSAGNRILLPKKVLFMSDCVNRYIAQLPLVNRICLVHYRVVKKRSVTPEETARNRFSCSVVIPARNEKGNIENVLKRLPRLGKSTEVIFVEGHSEDGTWEEINRVAEDYRGKWEIQFMKQDGEGKGDAVRKGFSAARGDILIILDADLSVSPEDLSKFYVAIATGKGEFLNGSRLVYPLEKEAMNFLNIIGNKVFSILFTYLLGRKLKDTLCGTKVLFREDYEKITRNRAYFGDFDPFGDYDLIFGAVKQNLKIVEIPVRYKSRTYGTTNIRRFNDGWLLFKMCLFAARKIKFF